MLWAAKIIHDAQPELGLGPGVVQVYGILGCLPGARPGVEDDICGSGSV